MGSGDGTGSAETGRRGTRAAGLGRRAALAWLGRLAVLPAVPAPLLRAGAARGDEGNRFLEGVRDRGRLEDAIAAERPGFEPPGGVTGITVPHHLVAADLIARGFWAASAGGYRRVVLVSPDHFRRVADGFAVDPGGADTVFGRLDADGEAVAALLAAPGLFEAADLSGEHGIQALLPFVARFFPQARIVAVAAGVNTAPAGWQAAAQALAPLLSQDTLLVQSTDYSHYLTQAEAVARDAETLAALASGVAESVLALRQPAHLDSRAAQWLQLDLQARLGARGAVLAHRSSVDYGGSPGLTTSYLVSAFHRDPAALSRLRYPDQRILYFAGDTLLGRYLTPALRDPAALEAVLAPVEAVTGGAPLVVNLEGILVGEPVAGLPEGSHLMLADLAGPVLRRLGVVAASLANNHSGDFGAEGLAASREALSRLGIVPLMHGRVADLGAVRAVALTFLLNAGGVGERVGEDGDLDALCRLDAAPPLVAFVHWGTEYESEGGEGERAAAARLAACGVSLVVGAHSHRASSRIETVAGAVPSVYSLGNFIFDQNGRRASGALLEVRVFGQGTLAARLVPIPNLFDAARAAAPGTIAR